MTAERTAKPVPPEVIERLKDAVGRAGVLDDPADMAPYCKSFRDGWEGRVPLVLRPASTAEVASVVRICAEAGVGIVPQGGNTGLTGGSQPHADMSEVIVSTSRLNRIRAIDTVNDTITVEAGVVLKEIQNAADRADRLFPAEPGRGRLLPDRRQHLHQRRRRATCCATAIRATSCSGWRWCCPTAASGTACGACARTTPATT